MEKQSIRQTVAFPRGDLLCSAVVGYRIKIHAYERIMSLEGGDKKLRTLEDFPGTICLSFLAVP